MKRCAIEGCEREANVPGSAQGLCRAHYRRMQRYGDALAPYRREPSWNGQSCEVDGCDKPIAGHALCSTHLAQLSRQRRRKVDPEGQRRRAEAWKERYRAWQEQLMGRPRPAQCEICHESGSGRGNKPLAGICFDHDHATGKPRGWLCDRCNKFLGLVRDNRDLLKKLTAYLEFHHGAPHVLAEKEPAEEGFRGAIEAGRGQRWIPNS